MTTEPQPPVVRRTVAVRRWPSHSWPWPSSRIPGRVVADTKLDLVVDPARFLGRSLLAWDPHAGFGQLQNQAYGYLFPMGPFYLLGHAAEVPEWVVQRAWWALLLVVAYTGLLALADELRIGTPTTRLVAAVAFALSPRVLSTLGPLSIESWPFALSPWILLPLVRGSARGDPRRHALTSALLFACVGAVNAAATIGALLPAVLWLASRRRGPRRRQLTQWWVAGVALASTWWVLPLLVLARYAYPFLDYIESARTTTSVTSVPNVLRGVSDWVAFSPSLGEPSWPAGWALATAPLVAAGHRCGRCRGAAGHSGAQLPGTPLPRLVAGHRCGDHGRRSRRPARRAGPRACSTARSSPSATCTRPSPCCASRSPSALAQALAVLPILVRAGWSPRSAAWGLPRAEVAVRVAAGAVARGPGGRELAGVGRRPRTSSLASRRCPATGSAPRPGWTAIPTAGPCWSPGPRSVTTAGDTPTTSRSRRWHARRWLFATRCRSVRRAPRGCSTGSAPSWPAAARPLGSRARWRAAGVGRLLLRNDLDARAPADPLAVIRATLAGSPGIRRVATFGPPLDGTEGQVADLVGSPPARPALEIWDVERGSPDVSVSPLADVSRLGGGPEATVPMAAAGLARVPTLDVGAGTPGLAQAPAVVTDTLRRRDLDFGSIPGSGYGPTLPASTAVGSGRAAGDVLAAAPAAQTVARFAGEAAVRSSPSAADPRLPGWRGPGAQAASAFDGDPSTAWISADTGGRRWLEVSWPRPHQIATLRILPAGIAGLATPERVRVTTDAGSVTGRADATGTTVVPLKGPTRRVRLDLLGAPPSSQVAIAEVGGLEVPERLVLPRETPVDATRDTVLLTRSPDRGSCVPAAEWLCSPRLARPGEDPADLASRVHRVGARATLRCTPPCARCPALRWTTRWTRRWAMSRPARAPLSTTLRPAPERRWTATTGRPGSAPATTRRPP